ncbi:DUF6090 family protein [Winogradskyella sp. A3E31]|uniref:DUF6090 family protein n=1 Tax=Winogradskyella sp. A3E31 TaxID=3349637 RepID=UPI00398B7FB9
MEQNKTGKYLKYAIGEILLVVIGILIALQINNWNESRKAQIQEQLLLNNLRVEFEDNLKDLDSINGEVDKVIVSLENVFELFGPSPKIVSLDSLDYMLSSSLSSPNWRPSEYLLNNLAGSGSIADLKNEKLKLLLYKWSRLRNQMLEVDVRTEKTGEEIIAYLKKYGSLRNADVTNEQFNYRKSTLGVSNLELLSDPQFENHIDDKLYMYGNTKTILKEAKALIVKMIEETEGI